MRPFFTMLALPLAFTACAPRSSMPFEGVRTARHGEFFTDGHTLVVRTTYPMGQVLVVFPPDVSDGKVLLHAGEASSGSGGLRVDCFDIDRIPAPPNWWDRVFWIEPDRSLTRVTPIVQGEAAREALAVCAVRASQSGR